MRGVGFAEIHAMKGSLSLVQVEERTVKLQAEVSRRGCYYAATCRFLVLCYVELILHPYVSPTSYGSNCGCRWTIDLHVDVFQIVSFLLSAVRVAYHHHHRSTCETCNVSDSYVTLSCRCSGMQPSWHSLLYRMAKRSSQTQSA